MESDSKVNIEDIAWRFKAYAASIDYNPHRLMHQSIEEYFEGSEHKFIDYDECVKADEVYVVRVYPDTGVGFYEICSRFHDDAVNKMIEVMREERNLTK